MSQLIIIVFAVRTLVIVNIQYKKKHVKSLFKLNKEDEEYLLVCIADPVVES